ncbi:Polyadenylate-binding protein, putative [Trichomonas vaginalis G3]|uniref:Polyadenylate-binding protein, putative n=1 Tax=Trichomonas vaginalis (strain ATCC PRA-98 / G3) TaxID=412133 RepID=A2FYE4_TRIV3|nr:RNA binding [Trichomonas vaginalis G3]EAX90061.1 Polyadenylate-binding protein, putative [Trichomonas vaginalis G3]KAI5515514.1 RNA binding [Trichomonas vaginalis G3]|eukprot:XP_001302991.1 Polyadenylate-binding protein [Trichomonas vaginalis G3]
MDPNWKEVFVGDLPGSVDENFIKEIFKDYGSFPSGTVTVKKHKSLDKSFAFVTFESHELAKRAISEVNYTKLDGVPIRILWSDPGTKRAIKNNVGALFIRGLDENIEVSQLHDAFSNFGEIVSCKIPLTNGKSRGYGFITFYKEDDAKRAKTDLADASINGKPIQIEFYQKPTRKNPEETFTNVFIKPLPADIFKTDDDLANFFKEFGDFVVTGKANPAIKRKEDGSSCEFGFCNFKHHEDAVKAVDALNGKQHESGKVTFSCCRAQTKAERQAFLAKQSAEFRRRLNEETRGRNLYVKNFDQSVTDEQFKEYFEQFGEVEKCSIRREAQEPHESKGFGFVLFKTKESAQNALENAVITPLNGKTPYIGLFKMKEEREREKASNQRKQQPKGAMIPNTIGGPVIPTQQIMMQSMMMPQVPVSAPATSKDLLKNELTERNISGSKLKAILSSISEEQAKSLCSDQEKLNHWVEEKTKM